MSLRIGLALGALTLAGAVGIGVGVEAVNASGSSHDSTTKADLGTQNMAGVSPQDAYFNALAPMAQQMSREYNGVPASVALAQSAIESNWGKSKLTVNDRNYFGFKCVGAGQPGPIANACHDYVTHEDNPPRDIHAYFRVYSSQLNSFRDYGRLMNTSGYASALQFKKDPNRFIQAIAPRYSTNPNYANSVIATMRAHNLYRFDNGTPAPPQPKPPAPPSGGKYWVTTWRNATGFANVAGGNPQGTLNGGTNYVYCKVWGMRIGNGSQFNHWWMRTDLDHVYPGKSGRNAYVSAYYLSRWGNDQAKDNAGRDIPNC